MIAINDEVTLDIPQLLETKLLIQANSGGGKTHMIRRILEQSHGRVQHMVIDIEGGLRTLREKYEYIILGHPEAGDDFLLTPENAGQLALMFLEFQNSIILHLGPFKESVRQEIVKNFLESLMLAPTHLWHPVFVVIDEAHKFCPQIGSTLASEPIKDLCSRGRYRTFCAFLATQRVTKLHNDAQAECNNQFYGRATLAADQKRSNEKLDFPPKDKRLETVAPGTFYGFGPALLPSHSVQKIIGGPVATTHPEPGSHIKSLPPPASMATVLESLKSVLAQPAVPTKEKQEQTHTKRKQGNNGQSVSVMPISIAPVVIPSSALEQENTQLREIITQQQRRIVTLLQVTTKEQQLQAETLQAASVNIEHAIIHQFNAGTGGSTQENIAEKKQVNVQLAPEKPALNEAKFKAFKKRFDALSASEKALLRVLLINEEKYYSLADIALWLQVKESTVVSNYAPKTLLQWNIVTRRSGTKTYYQSRLRQVLQQEFPEADIEQLKERLLPSS